MDYTNYNYELDKRIKESGLWKKHICKKLDLSYQSFRLKMCGKSPFTDKDIKGLMEILNLTPDDVVNLFLS